MDIPIASRPGPVVTGGGGGGSMGRVQPVAQREDRFARGGRALLAAARGGAPLERLLSVARLALGLLADVLRPGAEAIEVPVLTLGHHYLSIRAINTAGGSPAGNTTAGKAEGGGGAAGPAGAAAAALRLQEICTFDPREGPKRYADPATDEARAPLATLHWRLVPVAHAKAKRLGRDLSVKIELGGACSVVLYPTAAAAAAAGNGNNGGEAATPSTASGRAPASDAGGDAAPAGGGGGGGGGEVYEIQMPALLLLDPLAAECPLAFKGDLMISCPQTGLAAALRIGKDNSVEGVLEGPPQPPPGAAAGEGFGGARGGGGGGSAPKELGVFHGSWRGRVFVVCPGLAMQGVVFDCAEGVPPAAAGVLSSVNLRRPGPLACHRLWAALHDAVLYTDPRAATGGKPAVRLAGTLATHLSALTLGGPGAPAVGGAGGAAAGGPSGAAGDDADIAAFDRAAEALAAGGGGSGAPAADARAVPPCYKEQHANGRRLWYTLSLALTAGGPAAAH